MPERTERQTLLFSATLSHRVLELAYEHIRTSREKPSSETESVTAAKVRQRLYHPADDEKIPLLIGLLAQRGRADDGVRQHQGVRRRVARALERAGYRVGVLSGDVPQKKRESLLKKFQAGQFELLVSTDVASAGLYIDGVSHVYNWMTCRSGTPRTTSTASAAPPAPRSGRRRDQLRLRALCDEPAGHRALHRPVRSREPVTRNC